MRKLRHTRLDNFARVVYAIPAYPHYVQSGDVVVFTPEKCPQILRALLRGSQQRLVLLNATAQAALTHHLDDPASKSMSYQINQRVAQHTEPPALTPDALLKMAAEAAAHVMGQYFPVLIEARLAPLEQGQGQLAARMDAVEHATVTEYKGLVNKCAHLEAECQSLKGEIALLKAPDDWRTVLEFMRG